jgi:membrane-associated phospholipid phosphatase
MKNAPAEEAEAAPVRFGKRAVLCFGAVLATAIAFAILLILVKSKSAGLLRLDTGVAGDLHRFIRSHRTFTSLMRAASDLGSSPVWWAVLLPVAGWLGLCRLPRLAAFVVVTAIGSSLLNNAIKLVVDRARPHLADPVATAGGGSFPSGHAQAAIVGYGVLLLVFLPLVARAARPWLIAFAGLLVLTIGFSRIALGVHFFSDVIGGYLIGGAWLIAMTHAFSAWRTEEGKPSVRPTEGLEPEQAERLAPGPAAHAPPENASVARSQGTT